MSGLRILTVWALALAMGGIASAQDGLLRLVRLQFAEAEAIAGLLGGLAPGRAVPNPDFFVYETIAEAARRLPGGAGVWFQRAAGRVYPTGDGATIRPPEGLTDPPVAIPQQNAILLRGTPEAIDQTEEIIRLLDKPQPMINVDLRMIDDPTEQVQQWGIDFQASGPQWQGGTVGNAPASGLMLRWGLANVQALAGLDLRRSRGRNVVGANVTTFDNTPATVSFGQALPFFVAHVTYDAWGNRQVDYEPNVIFTGIELYVLPRITGNNTVTMRIVPTLTDAVGAVTAPDGSSVPITKTVFTDLLVRVPDGESLVIGGLERATEEATQRFASLLGETKVSRASHPVLVVTPRIIRPVVY